jgi:hypothetical protein
MYSSDFFLFAAKMNKFFDLLDNKYILFVDFVDEVQHFIDFP